MLIEALLVGGTLYAGARTYRQLKASGRLTWRRRRLAQPSSAALAALFDATAPSPALQQANQSLALSSASLGLATAGLFWMGPVLSVISILPMIYVFIPTFQAAWRTLVKERRINNPVLDAVRISVCVVMGYSFVAALNACLQAISQRHFAQAEADFRRRLRELFGTEQTMVWCFVDGAEVQIPLAEAPVGAIVAVAAGEIIPITGVIVYGNATLNQHFVTGEAGMVRKQRGEHVVAGAMLQEGRIYVQVEQTGQLPITSVVRRTLERSLEQKTVVQQMGETSADRMAPRMLLTFALTLPLMGAYHATAFLTTGFGAHLRTLGPYTVRNFLIPAAEQGIVIKDARALEWVNRVNTVLIDGRVLADPLALTQAKTAIYQLHQRPLLIRQFAAQRFAVYVLVETGAEAAGAKLVAELGLDDYFAETLPSARATLVERLQLGGRMICYVGSGRDDNQVMEKAHVAIAWRSVAALTSGGAHVVLMDNDLRQLVRFFEMSTAFAARQGFSLLTPIGLDIADIATTVIVHLGLGYSILFNYAGLWLGAAFARWRPTIQEAPSAADQSTEDVQTITYPLLPPLATST